MKKLFTFLTMLVLGIGSMWAESKISQAVAGTYLFDSSNPALTVNKGGATITSNDGAIIIHHDDLSIVSGTRTYAAVVMKVDMPTTAPGTFAQFINLKTSSNNNGSIGLGVTTDGKLKGTWQAGEYGPVTTNAVTGEHTVVLLCNNSGTTIYVDNANTSVIASDLKCGTKWTDLRIESAYTSCIKSVYVLSGEQSGNISTFFSELSNVVTVANAETKSVSENNTATRFFVASGGTLTVDAAYDMDKIEGAGDVTIAYDTSLSGGISSIATGKLTINEGKTLTVGNSCSTTASIASFNSVDLEGTIYINNSKTTINTLTIPEGSTGTINLWDTNNNTEETFKLAGTTSVNGKLTFLNDWKGQATIEKVVGVADIDIIGWTAGSSESYDGIIYTIADATEYTGSVTLNNPKNTVNVSGNLIASSWTKTKGTLNYKGNNLAGTTLDGVVLASTTARVTTSGIVNIKNLAGCNLPNPSGNYGYAFIGSGGTINLYGTCDFTKKADGTTALSSNLGYGSSASIVIKNNATVTAGVVYNTNGTTNDNASITVESGATLNTIGWTHADDVLYAKNLTNDGTINLSTGRMTSNYGLSKIHNTLSGSGALNIAEGANLEVASVPSTITLSGSGNVKLTNFPSSTAPTISNDWTGTIEFPNGGSNGTDLQAIFNAWGNTNSTIKLNNVTGGYLGNNGTVNPTLNILSGKTLTLNNGFSGSNSTLTKVTGAGTLNRQSWSGSNNHNLIITTLTGFTGTLSGTGHPIIVKKLVLENAPDADDLLIKTSGTVTLNTEAPDGLYVGLQRTSAYTWETKTVEDVEGIYVVTFDQVQRKRETAIALVTPYYNGGYVGTGLGKYTISLGETSYAEMSDFGNAVMSWKSLKDCVEPTISLNMPANGFYRFTSQNNSHQKGNVGKYLHNNLDNGGLALNATKDEKTIFYVDRTNNTILAYANGRYLNSWNSEPTVGNPATWGIEEGTELGKYALKIGSDWYASDWNTTDHITFGNKDANALWAIEAVDELPFTFNKAALGYATFNSPVACKLDAGTKAYTCQQNLANNTINLQLVELTKDGNVLVPANCPVLLFKSGITADDASNTVVNFTIVESDEEIDDNDFVGTIESRTLDTNYNWYSLQKVTSGTNVGKMCFLSKSAGEGSYLGGFKAWIKTNPTTARQFTLVYDGEGDPTGIVEALGLENDNVDIYDLSGRKLSSYKKGINIVNGKKVMVQ